MILVMRALVIAAAAVVTVVLAWLNGYGYGFDAARDINSP